MGAGVDEKGRPRVCDGSDVCDKLDKVFGDPTSHLYTIAKGKKGDFLKISQGQGNYKTLHDLYIAVGVKDTDGWEDYLSTLEPGDIKRLALARFEGLDRTKAMKTTTHDPQKGEGDHHAHFKQKEDLSYTIDAPFTPKPPAR